MGLNSMDDVSESHKHHGSTASMAYPTLTLSHTAHTVGPVLHMCGAPLDPGCLVCGLLGTLLGLYLRLWNERCVKRMHSAKGDTHNYPPLHSSSKLLPSAGERTHE